MTGSDRSDESDELTLLDRVVGMTGMALEDGRAEIERAEGRSGRLRIQIEVCLDRGTVPWHTAAVVFDRRFKHEV